MRARFAHGAPLLVVLLVTWILLQGELTVGNVLGGLGFAVALVVIFPVTELAVHHRLHPWALVKFVVFVLYSLVMSSWQVIKVIIRPTPTSLRAGIVRVRLTAESPATTTLVANAVTLTPGTMTLTARVHPAELHIHVLGLADPGAFRESVHDHERRTVAALTPVLDGRDETGSDPDGDELDDPDEPDVGGPS
jgi:multicomponent Na+:H+ antiporter subunit E